MAEEIEPTDADWDAASVAAKRFFEQVSTDTELAAKLQSDPVDALLDAGVPEWALPTLFEESNELGDHEVAAFCRRSTNCGVTSCKGTCFITRCKWFSNIFG